MSPEIHRQLNFLCGMPDYGNTTMDRKDTHELLMDTGGCVLACGRLYNIVAKDIGAGVYKVSLTLASP